MRSRRRMTPRTALSLIELLVLLLVIAIFVGLLLPALIGRREVVRSSNCEAHLMTLILAVQNYESTSAAYPAGVLNPMGPIANEPKGLHHSWIAQLTPFLDERSKLDQIDLSMSVYAEKHAKLRQTVLPVLVCPSAPTEGVGSSYAACHSHVETPIDEDNSGVFFLNSQISRNRVEDGLAYTLFLGEKRIPPSGDLGWLSGTRATLRNTGLAPNRIWVTEVGAQSEMIDGKFYVGGFDSWHAGHVHLAMGDGRVSATSESIDLRVYQQIGNRSDGTAQAEGQDLSKP